MSPSEPLPLSSDAVPGPSRELAPGDLVFANRLVNLEQVLPNITHELNNALQVISGLGEILSTRPDLPDDVVQKLQRIHAQSSRCYGLLRELLAYARRDEVSPTADVARLVDRTLNLRRYHLARARVTVAIEPGAPGIAVAMDSQYFVQMLLNLLLNAEQAMAGGTDHTLTLRYGAAAGDAVISVTDSGPGVDLADVEATCFVPFWTTREGALGMGLPVARALAVAAGGSLRFVAPSEVEVRLPLRR